MEIDIVIYLNSQSNKIFWRTEVREQGQLHDGANSEAAQTSCFEGLYSPAAAIL
jgi:hypothetical protein